MARRNVVNLDVDDRTNDMSDEALICRSRGHRWEERGKTRKRYQELIKEGYWEDDLVCANDCGYTKLVVWSLRTGEVISIRTGYPKDGSYLLPKGSTGRLLRSSARVARVSRLIPQLV